MPKTKKCSDSDNIPGITAVGEWSDGLKDISTSDKELQFLKLVALMRIGKSPRDAALTVGFSDAFCNSGIYQALQNPNSQLRKAAEKLDEFTKSTASRYRKTFAPLLAGTLAEIDLKMAETLRDDPVLAIKNPAALRQLKAQSGILADDGPAPVTINVQDARKLMLNVYQQRAALPEPALDAEIVGGESDAV
jgi:hypothetical protein